MLRESLEQRVKQREESLCSRRQPRHGKVLAPASALLVTGNPSVAEVCSQLHTPYTVPG